MLDTDQILVCASCNTEFNFSAAESSFYQQKGFAPPKRCKPCREAAKAQRNSGGGDYGHSSGGYGGGRDSGGYGGGYGAPRAPRELHDAVCASCGTQTQVPFRPTGERPVYCRDCFRK